MTVCLPNGVIYLVADGLHYRLLIQADFCWTLANCQSAFPMHASAKVSFPLDSINRVVKTIAKLTI